MNKYIYIALSILVVVGIIWISIDTVKITKQKAKIDSLNIKINLLEGVVSQYKNQQNALSKLKDELKQAQDEQDKDNETLNNYYKKIINNLKKRCQMDQNTQASTSSNMMNNINNVFKEFNND